MFAAQKGATAEQAFELEARLGEMTELAPHARLPGAGAAGGIGAALAYLGAQLVSGAELVLDLLGFEPSGYDLVVTGEGTVDATTRRGKAPGVVARRCCRARACAASIFGGIVVEPILGAETVALSGDPREAAPDLCRLGSGLGGVGSAG